MQDIQEIRGKIKQFISETSYISDDQIDYDTLIFAQGIMDSMGFISIIGFLEEMFSVSPSDSELVESNFESINAISNFVFRKLHG
jgi:acyl carrier protein